LDIGGDKDLPYIKFPHEMNPFLGYRAIRICLDQPEIFRPQVRALLRASVYGNLGIMFPMIATLDEWRLAKDFVLREKETLLKEGYAVSDQIQFGIMVEIPSAAVLAHEFAKEVDFFSIGTNDLIQYTFAADRMSEKVANLYQPLNPAILRLIKMTSDGANKNNIWTGVCGEMAAEPLAIPLLIGLGIEALSMSSASILKIKNIVLNVSYSDCVELVNQALDAATSMEVETLVKDFLQSRNLSVQ
jgi:phosphotransferase system enzyme I (PtsI)